MLSEQDIEAELSYAYLHLVASRAGFNCTVANRHRDNYGVDATVEEDGRQLDPVSLLLSFALHVQLKATRVPPVERDGRFSYSLPIGQYNALRQTLVAVPRILVMLFLPASPNEWVASSELGTTLGGCAYWVSLRGARTSARNSRTIYLPREQALTVESLQELMRRISLIEEITYDS